MGRLRRDRRMMGLFPSNFVQVLDESFQPQNRTPSPMPHRSSSTDVSKIANSGGNSERDTPTKPKTKFRKPFQAYHAASKVNSGNSGKCATESASQKSDSKSRENLKRTPFSSMKINSNHSRSASPSAPTLSEPQTLEITPEKSRQLQTHFRSRSPLPPIQNNSKSGSEPLTLVSGVTNSHVQHSMRDDVKSSPPPPPPPPHRIIYRRNTKLPSDISRSLEQPIGREHQSHSPKTSDSREGRTPSPLRDAMNEVIMSLEDMSFSKGEVAAERHQPESIWSPDAYEQGISQSTRSTRKPILWNDENEQALEHPQLTDPSINRNYEQFPETDKRFEGANDQAQSHYIVDERYSYESDVQPASQLSSPFRTDYGSKARRSPQFTMQLRNRRSAYEMGRNMLSRTFTAKSTVTSTSSAAQSSSTNNSSNTQITSQSLMSGSSAGGFSATSAGSFARRKAGTGIVLDRPASALEERSDLSRQPKSQFSGVTYHSSHDSTLSDKSVFANIDPNTSNPLGALGTPKSKKSGFFKKMIESAKTGAASARSTVGTSPTRPLSRHAASSSGLVPAPSGHGHVVQSYARDLDLSASGDWVQVRRDVNRSNSLSKNERNERAERCQMNDMPVIFPVDELLEIAEGDEGLDGFPINEPMEFSNVNFSLVDKSARFTNSLPKAITPAILAQGYLCRPYRSDIQRLRAMYTWLSERISWEDDFEGEVDLQRVLQTKRGSSREVSTLLMAMCASVGVHAECVRGYLKAPGEILNFEILARPNHWWNAVIADGEWRIIDCSLASPTNPRRSDYSYAGSHVAEGWWFLARPMEVCYTHVPLLPEQQHICPRLPHEVLMALPCACPPYFKHKLQLFDFDTSLLNLDGLEVAHIQFLVPDDVGCVAEVEARAFQRDVDGDFFENGDLVTKRALAQAEWVGGRKKYTVKALLPGDEGQAVLKVYAGKRGLIVSF